MGSVLGLALAGDDAICHTKTQFLPQRVGVQSEAGQTDEGMGGTRAYVKIRFALSARILRSEVIPLTGYS